MHLNIYYIVAEEGVEVEVKRFGPYIPASLLEGRETLLWPSWSTRKEVEVKSMLKNT